MFGFTIGTTSYFFLSASERKAKGEPKEKETDEKFGSKKYIEKVEDEANRKE